MFNSAPKKIIDKSREAEISEIFSSLQGEGPYLGVKQIFVRFGRCNMHCGYCDELEKMKQEMFSVYSLEKLLSEISEMDKLKGEHHSISLTGGEPLFYTPFLQSFLPLLKEKGHKVYLETNGTLPRELARVISYCDIIAMDMKPSSSTGDRSFEEQHEEFLEIALQKETFVKVVITPETKREEIERCIEITAKVDKKTLFIFQPLSDPFGINQKSMNLIEKEFFELAKTRLENVRVIPQMHKIWGVR